jgi:glycosyltransferase involved in cell wall biosynthesis
MVDDSHTPLVSVIVAAYNVEKYLGQCLNSLVNQTLKNIEIIVVNDASTDNSAGIINDYSARYPNIRAIHFKHNRGTATVRNIGMRVGCGQYITFTDGDDWVDIRMCEVMYRCAQKDNADVLIANANIFYEDSKCFGPLYDQQIRKSLDKKLKMMPFELVTEPRVLLLERVVWAKLYKRSFLEKHALQFEDGMNSYEDIIFNFSVLLKARRISLIDDILLFYRVNRPGQITARTNRKVFEVFDVFRKIQENLTTWEVSDDIWAQLVRVQLVTFDWLLDMVQAVYKEDFLALVAKQLETIPEPGLRSFSRHATPYELSRLFYMRNKWLYGCEQFSKRYWSLFSLPYMIHSRLPVFIKQNCRRMAKLYRSCVTKSLKLSTHDKESR